VVVSSNAVSLTALQEVRRQKKAKKCTARPSRNQARVGRKIDRKIEDRKMKEAAKEHFPVFNFPVEAWFRRDAGIR
jgi:hypothetical protein